MAETITIPSPSRFLNSPLQPAAPAPALKKSQKRQHPPSQPSASNPAQPNGLTKRKQSKSRNGCITCKAKRLKCDETKPACQQCARRSVTCGGYKKDFKWRPFEEANFVGSKPASAKPKKASSPPPSNPTPVKATSPAVSESSNITVGNNGSYQTSFLPVQSPQMQMQEPYFLDPAYFPAFGDAFSMPESAPYLMATTPVPVTEPFEPSSVASTASIFNDADTIGTMHTGTTAPSSITSGQSPRLVDLLLPGTDLNATPPEYLSFRSQYPDSFYQPYVFNEPPLPDPMDEDDNVEEIIRQPPDVNPDHEAWVMRLPSPSPSNSSSSSEGSVVLSRDAMDFILLQEPQFPHGSPEMLTLRFDRQTCGILSVKDGPTENPWRTLIWPLARDCPALYHAIASMTSFHACKNAPELRIQGIEHMRTSISALRSGIQNMRFDSAIATTLVLAFAESWDQDTTTGINHIKGAKALVNQALIKQQSSSTSLTSEEVSRLKFLCNTWIYMDVIARLTSVDEDESNDFVTVSEAVSSPFDADGNLDPLMGCAATLFPIIGAVANLVRRVRRSESISPTIITQAMELKLELENWVPPSFFETPEDPTLHIQHSIQTAEAYRWATLLYLHQAVPEIPSLSSEELAKKVLVYLATVPLSSRAVIVQIFPLTAAGCEAVSEEDRAWVKGRWEAMAQRMLIGVIDRCAEVAKEVWDRRDAYEMEKRKRRKSLKRSTTMDDEMSDALALGLMDFDGFGGTSGIGSKRRALSGVFDMPLPVKVEGERRDLRERERQRRGKRREDVGIEKLEEEYTVKGRLHWLGVMKDWQWEVLLG